MTGYMETEMKSRIGLSYCDVVYEWEKCKRALEIYADPDNWRKERVMIGMSGTIEVMKWLGPKDLEYAKQTNNRMKHDPYKLQEGPEIAQRALAQGSKGI